MIGYLSTQSKPKLDYLFIWLYSCLSHVSDSGQLRIKCRQSSGYDPNGPCPLRSQIVMIIKQDQLT